MTTQEWQTIKKYMPNYFSCVYLWSGVTLGAIGGVILLESIIRVIGR